MSDRAGDLGQLLEKAAKARSDADEAVLDNVRVQLLRAEAAWLEMADRARRDAALRSEQAAVKAARPPYVMRRRSSTQT